ncbi:MAG: SycD/LcrH family type III secretion system chaperone [Waddliaceae bacterium]
MKGDQKEMLEAVEKLGKSLGEEKKKDLDRVSREVLEKQLLPKNALGMNDSTIEGLYGQAFRLYNSGKYKDASHLFRLLIMLDSTEPRYTHGLAACFHMMKDYKNAVHLYTLCSVFEPKNPVPHYHASDCYMQIGDKVSAMVSLEMAIKRAGDKAEFKTLKDRAQMTLKSLEKELKLKKKKRE